MPGTKVFLEGTLLREHNTRPTVVYNTLRIENHREEILNNKEISIVSFNDTREMILQLNKGDRLRAVGIIERNDWSNILQFRLIKVENADPKVEAEILAAFKRCAIEDEVE